MRWAGVVVAFVSVVGCATTNRICPVGTELVRDTNARGRAQWCSSTTTLLSSIPAPGRDQYSVLGIAAPTAMAGGVEGPFTSWHPNGRLESHGTYVSYGERSVPDGVWGFWHANGQRHTLGTYRRAQPTGCFAVWDESGTRSTGVVEGDRLRIEACTPPADDAMVTVERGHVAPSERRTWGDLALHGFVGAGGIGARNAQQVDPDPALSAVFNAVIRKRIGAIRVGPSIGLRVSDNAGYRATSGGAVVAVRLPSPHLRLDLELSADVGVQYITATARRRGQRGVAELGFWSPLGGVELGASFALSSLLEARAGVRFDGAPIRAVDRDVVYCDYECVARYLETWDVGGVSYGVNLGLRLLIR